MRFRLLFQNFSKLLLEDLTYPILLVFLIIFELMFNLLIGHSVSVKFPSIIIANFFMSIILTMYFLKKDTNENKYLKQRINDYWEYTISQITTLVLFDLMTAIISGICTGIFSDTPAANAAMFLTLMTTAWLGTAIVFVCRSLYTNHKYIAALCLVLIVLFSFADSNNNILIYINWVLPPVSNIIVTFQEHSNMVSVLPLVLRQLIYAIILFVISGFFNKKNYSK